jgi:hypothetical protein
MTECAVYSGILFSRQRCGEPATLHCGRCKIPLCKKHLVAQQSGPFMCPQCSRYENDDDHDWEYTDDGWQWRGANTGTAGAAAGLDESDEQGFVTDARAATRTDAESDLKENDFDAS